MRILACDPGKKNYAWALLEDGQVIDYGHFEKLLHDLTGDFSTQLKTLRREVRKLLRKCDLNKSTDFIVMERFMRRRGQGKGSVSEYINLQIGAIAAWALPVETYLFPSSKWKRGLTKTYGFPKGEVTEHLAAALNPQEDLDLTLHEADAIGMGIYCFDFELKTETLPRIVLPL